MIAILLLALGLRLWGIDFGLPNLTRPDEQNVSNAAVLNIMQSFFAGHPTLNPNFFYYPSLFIYLITLCFSVYYGIGHAIGFFPTAESFMQLYLNDWSSFLLIERVVSAIFGTLTVWAVVQLGTAINGSDKGAGSHPRWFGLACGALLAITYLPVRESHFGVTDMAATFWATLCLWQSVVAIREKNQRAISISMILAGLAASTKYPLGLVAVAPMTAFYILAKAQGARFADFIEKTELVKRELQLGGLLLGAFLLTSPFVLLDFQKFWADFTWQQNTFHNVFAEENIAVGWIRHLTFSLWYGLGPMYLIIALLGMGLAYRSKDSWHWPLFLFSAIYYVALGSNKTVYVRYVLPVVPVLCCYAIYAVQQLNLALQKQVTDRTLRIVILAVFGLGMTWSSLSHSIQFDALQAKPDTRSQAREWLMNRLQPGDGVGIGQSLIHIDLPNQYIKYFLSPLPPDQAASQPLNHALVNGELSERSEARISTYNDVEALRRYHVRYVTVGRSPLHKYTVSQTEMSQLDQNPGLKRVQTFSGTAPGQSVPPESAYDWIDAFFTPYSRFDGLTAPGPEILIYQVLPAVDSNQKAQ